MFYVYKSRCSSRYTFLWFVDTRIIGNRGGEGEEGKEERKGWVTGDYWLPGVRWQVNIVSCSFNGKIRHCLLCLPSIGLLLVPVHCVSLSWIFYFTSKQSRVQLHCSGPISMSFRRPLSFYKSNVVLWNCLLETTGLELTTQPNLIN